MDVRSMPYSDQVILGVLRELLAAKGADSVITQEMIAAHSGASLRTTQRALKRLTKSGAVIGTRTVPTGYRYRIANGSSHAND